MATGVKSQAEPYCFWTAKPIDANARRNSLQRISPTDGCTLAVGLWKRELNNLNVLASTETVGAVGGIVTGGISMLWSVESVSSVDLLGTPRVLTFVLTGARGSGEGEGI
jgi:hypothetical protein